MEVTALTRVPTGPSHLLGLANLQGAVVPVIDVRPRLDLPTPPWSWPLPVHLVGRGELQVAVAVEEVLGFEPYAPDRVAPLLAGDAPAGLAAFTRGTAPLRTGRALLIDLPGVLAALRPALLSPSPASAVHHAEEGLPWQIR
jgi:purine-binding chemotaxis protein CheW